MIAQFPALEHLEPPVDLSARIAIERFSPYFNRPELGFSVLRPAEQYRLTYDLPESELHDFAYVFDAPRRGIGTETADRLDDALRLWQDSYPTSRLTHQDLGDLVVLVNRRRAFPWSVRELSDRAELTLFRLLEQPHTPAALARKSALEEPAVHAVLTRRQEWGLLFTDAGQYVHVAPESVNESRMRVEFMRDAHTPEPTR